MLKVIAKNVFFFFILVATIEMGGLRVSLRRHRRSPDAGLRRYRRGGRQTFARGAECLI